MHGAVHSFTARVATMTPRRDQAGVRSQPRRGQGRQKDRRWGPEQQALLALGGGSLSLSWRLSGRPVPLPADASPVSALDGGLPKPGQARCLPSPNLHWGRDRQTRKQRQTLREPRKRKWIGCKGAGGCSGRGVREGHSSLLTADGLGSLHNEFPPVSICLWNLSKHLLFTPAWAFILALFMSRIISAVTKRQYLYFV